MPEPMSNREIEDVLTSIRRLVAQEGGRVENGRLILTESQRIKVSSPDAELAVDDESSVPALDEQAPAEVAIPAPDFGRLEATIAELEAAVSAREDGFERDAPEVAPKVSNVTELYGRLSFSHRSKTPEAPVEEAVAETDSPATAPAEAKASEIDAAPLILEQSASVSADDVLEPEAATSQATVEAEAAGATEYDEHILDEDALREWIAQIVREELRGQLGERITLQVRKLVRAEIAKALDDRALF